MYYSIIIEELLTFRLAIENRRLQERRQQLSLEQETGLVET